MLRKIRRRLARYTKLGDATERKYLVALEAVAEAAATLGDLAGDSGIVYMPLDMALAELEEAKCERAGR
jgi:hypothetical protein